MTCYYQSTVRCSLISKSLCLHISRIYDWTIKNAASGPFRLQTTLNLCLRYHIRNTYQMIAFAMHRFYIIPFRFQLFYYFQSFSVKNRNCFFFIVTRY